MPEHEPPARFTTERDPAALRNVLAYGSLETRRRLAAELARGGDATVWALLCGTARSAEPWQIRARCLEMLGMAVGSAEAEVAEQILAVFTGTVPAAGAGPAGSDHM